MTSSQSSVSTILTSSKLNPKTSYNSVNISSGAGGLNISQDAHSNGDSGANTPSHLSQQNIIKFMKKIKSSSIQAPVMEGNKENMTVAPPNIITS